MGSGKEMELWFEALTLTNGGSKAITPTPAESSSFGQSGDGGGSMKLG